MERRTPDYRDDRRRVRAGARDAHPTRRAREHRGPPHLTLRVRTNRSRRRTSIADEALLCNAASMATKADLGPWLLDALEIMDGAAHHVRVAEHIWTNHEAELKVSGDLLYTWQYDLRWTAQSLRAAGTLLPIDRERRHEGLWSIRPRANQAA